MNQAHVRLTLELMFDTKESEEEFYNKIMTTVNANIKITDSKGKVHIGEVGEISDVQLVDFIESDSFIEKEKATESTSLDDKIAI